MNSKDFRDPWLCQGAAANVSSPDSDAAVTSQVGQRAALSGASLPVDIVEVPKTDLGQKASAAAIHGPFFPAPPPTKTRRVALALPTLPDHLVTAAREQGEGVIVSSKQLIQAAYKFKGVHPQGLAGTLRWLGGLPVQAQLASQALRAEVDFWDALFAAFLAGTPATRPMMLEFGDLAEKLTTCCWLGDPVPLEQARAYAAECTPSLIEHLDALLALGEPGRRAAAKVQLDHQHALTVRLQKIVANGGRPQIGRSGGDDGMHRWFAAAVQKLEDVAKLRRETLRQSELHLAFGTSPDLVPVRAPNSPGCWPTTGVQPTVYEDVEREFSLTMTYEVHLNESRRQYFCAKLLGIRTSAPNEFVSKAGMLMTLSELAMAQRSEQTLQEGVRFIDYALHVLAALDAGDHPDLYRAMHHRAYKLRGTAHLQLAQRMDDVVGAQRGRRYARKRRDAAYRDFCAAWPKAQDVATSDPGGYVTAAERSKSLPATGAVELLAAACVVDDDLAEAHYQKFWRQLEVSGLEAIPGPAAGAALLAGTSPDELQPHIDALEQILATLHAAELTALYRHHQVPGAEALERNHVRRILGHVPYERSIKLRLFASKLYAGCGGSANMASGLLHLCQAVAENERLLHQQMAELALAADGTDRAAGRRRLHVLQKRSFRLLSHRAAAYGRLGLLRCQVADLRAALQLVRERGWRARAPRTHLALGLAYRRQGQLASAREQLRLAIQGEKAPHAVRRKAGAHLEALGKQQAGVLVVDRRQAEQRALVAFASDHVLAECLQVLEDNERGCGNVQGVVWRAFVDELSAAPDVKAWCETILAHVRLTDSVNGARVYRLLLLADMELGDEDPALLPALQALPRDALRELRAQKLREQDAWTAKRDAARADLERINAFAATSQALAAALQAGDRIRPGSAGRADLEALAARLRTPGAASDGELDTQLRALLPSEAAAGLAYVAAHRDVAYAELSRVVDAALRNEASLTVEQVGASVPGAVGHAVLHVTGSSLFLSQLQEQVYARLAAEPAVREVRVVADNLYVDVDLTLPGTHLTLGADRIEWLTARAPDGSQRPITIDLTGRHGVAAPKSTLPKAASGASPGASGLDGAAGEDGAGGEAGGDLVVQCAEACVGFTSANVAAIQLGGGAGGAGASGQDGGNAQAGAPGRSAEQKWRDEKWAEICAKPHAVGPVQEKSALRFGPEGRWRGGYVELFRGEAGGAAGTAGIGGAAGLGGEGGRSGQLHLVGTAATDISTQTRAELVQRVDGTQGQDGLPGHGGKGALGGADGLDCVLLKRNPFFRPKRKHGRGLRPVGHDQRRLESWEETYLNDEATVQRGASADRNSEYASRPHVRRRHRAAHLDVAAVSRQVEGLLGRAAGDAKSAGGLTATRASASETVALLATDGAEIDAALGEIKALQQTHASQTAQAQRRTQTMQRRGESVQGVTAPEIPAGVRIYHDGEAPLDAPDTPLNLWETPVPHPVGQPLVVHAVELAMAQVNATHGVDPVALGELMERLGAMWAAATPALEPDEGTSKVSRLVRRLVSAQSQRNLPKQAEATALLQRLLELIERAPLVGLVADVDCLNEGVAALAQGAAAWPALKVGLKSLRSAVAGRVLQAQGVSQLYVRAKEILTPKLAAKYRDLRLLAGLRRTLATDRLLRSVLAADADMPATRPRQEAAGRWLEGRLRQRLERLVAMERRVAPKDEAFSAGGDASLKQALDGLAGVRQQAAPGGSMAGRGIKALVHALTGQLDAIIEDGRAQLADYERQIEVLLLPTSAHLVLQNAQKASWPAGWTEGGLELPELVASLRESGDLAPHAAPAVAGPRSRGSTQSRAPASATFRQRLWSELQKQVTATRLLTHLERQLAQLDTLLHLGSAKQYSQAAEAFAAVYAHNSLRLDEEMRPSAGEALVAFLACTPQQLQQLVPPKAALQTSRFQNPALRLLEHLVACKDPYALISAPEAAPVDDDSEAMSRAIGASKELLLACATDATVRELVKLAEKTRQSDGPGSSETVSKRSPSRHDGQAEDATWAPMVHRWISYRALVPDANFLAGARAVLEAGRTPEQPVDDAASDLGSSIAWSALDAETRATLPAGEPAAWLAHLKQVFESSPTPPLPKEARAALFLLLNCDAGFAITSGARVLVRQRAEATASSGAHEPLLTMAEVGLSGRLFDQTCDLAEAWNQALERLELKLELVERNKQLQGSVPTAQITELVAKIGRGHRHLSSPAQAEVLQSATRALAAGLGTIVDHLRPVHAKILGAIGRLNRADGWDPDRAERFNEALKSASAALNGPGMAETAIQLIAGLTLEACKEADAARMQLAVEIFLHEVPFAPRQEVVLYGHLHRLQAVLPTAANALDVLRARWLQRVDAETQALAAQETKTRGALKHDRHQFSASIADIVAAADVSEGHAHLAALELVVALLDRHFETNNTDRNGDERRGCYERIEQNLRQKLAEAPSIDVAFRENDSFAQQQLHQLVNPGSKSQLEYFDQVIAELATEDLDEAAVRSVIGRLEALSWRGVLTYYADRDANITTSLEERIQSTAPRLQPQQDAGSGPSAAYPDLLRCIKVKFASHLTQDDASLAREAAQTQVTKREDARAASCADFAAWLASPKRTPEELFDLDRRQYHLYDYCRDPLKPRPKFFGRPPEGDATTSTAASTTAPQNLEASAALDPENLLEACRTYVGRCNQALAITAHRDDKFALACADKLRLGALHAALTAAAAAQEKQAPTPGSEDKFAAALASVEMLQKKIIGHEEAVSHRRRHKTVELLRQAITSWSPTSFVREHLEAIVGLSPAKAGKLRQFLREQRATRQDTADVQGVLAMYSALDAAAVCFGDEGFLAAADSVERLTQHQGTPLSLDDLTQLWLAIPVAPSFETVEHVLSETLAPNWAAALRAAQCEAAMGEALKLTLRAKEAELPANVHVTQLDALFEARLEQQAADYAESMRSWVKWLDTLRTTPHLTAPTRGRLLALVAQKLTPFALGKMAFPRQDFAQFAQQLADDDVLVLLQREFEKSRSLVVQGLNDPSLETSQDILTHAWTVAKLGPALEALGSADQQRLVGSLMDLTAVRGQPGLRQVVEALAAGGPLTQNAIEAVTGFADRSFAWDATAMDLLAARAQRPDWFGALGAHTRASRSRMRGVAELAACMAGDKAGINASVADWVVGGPGNSSRLQRAVEGIHAALRSPAVDGGKPIGEMTAADILGWATHRTLSADGGWHYTHRGEQLWQDPARVTVALAVLSRAIHLTSGFWPRDAQLAALWLVVCDGGVAGARGRLAEVSTGEGKSLITAGLAVLKALGGHQVDVITTSRVLAARDATEYATLYTLFGLSVVNNCDDACEQGTAGTSAEDIRRERYFANGRPVDIIYGDAGAFERDQLLTQFHAQDPTRKIIHSSRQDQTKRCALVDEVDGLLLDNASTVLYLSHELESLRQFEHIFVSIWTLVNSPLLPATENLDGEAVAHLVELVRKQLETGDAKLPGYKVPNAPFMQLEKIVERRLSSWVKLALLARSMQLNHEYIVSGGTRPAVVVVDRGTGVEQASLKWSNGLHQFLQLKHGLEVEPESLKAVFLSNLFFFRGYKNQLFGLSGTLGSAAEQRCLKELFAVDLFKIPRAHGQAYVQKGAVVASDAAAWFDALQTEVRAQRDQGRATLVICDSIEEVLQLQTRLKADFPDLHTYTSTHQQLTFLNHQTPRPLQPGDLLLATNLAGRGTDLKTSPELERAGGLHVILSYLPANVRIQEQAFGRTARGANCGTGQFIIYDPSRRTLHELCRVRDLAERWRLERALVRDVLTKTLEQELLTGFHHRGEEHGGFAALLAKVSAATPTAETPAYYLQAQVDSLTNRWACWLDSVDEKLKLVHVTGKDALVAAYKTFVQGVELDMARGWEGLIVEPAEWLKLGSCYRRDSRWREAERCYALAARDPAYAFAGYYKASSQLVHTPTSAPGVKKAFRTDAKAAVSAVEQKMQLFRECAQQVSVLAARGRQRGDQDFGDPYQQRAKEKLEVWQIFLTSLHDALGSEVTAKNLTKSAFIKDRGHAQQVIDALVSGEVCKPMRVSGKFQLEGDTFRQAAKDILGLGRFAPVTARLAQVLRPGEPVLRQAVIDACGELKTIASLRESLHGKFAVRGEVRAQAIPDLWAGWNDSEQEGVRIHRVALSERYAKTRRTVTPDCSLEGFRALLSQPARPEDVPEEVLKSFLELLTDHGLLSEAHWLIFPPTNGAATTTYEKDETARAAVKVRLAGTDAWVVDMLCDALIERKFVPGVTTKNVPQPTASFVYAIRDGVFLEDLPVFTSAEAAAEILRSTLQTRGAIKAPKLLFPDHVELSVRKGDIRRVLQSGCSLDSKDAVNSVFAILEPTIGMLRTLDDKKVTIKFVEVARSYFLDHGQAVPPALREFVEAGLDVVASVIERKDPPAWFEVAALVLLGMAQVVAGTLMKELCPLGGELLGNTLVNTGIDDIIFGVTCAIRREFAWEDYWDAKGASMLSALKNAAVVSAASFAHTAAHHGTASAWRLQQLSHADRLDTVARVPGVVGVNMAAHVGKEVGRAVMSSTISQLANRGISVVIREVADLYGGSLQANVTRDVEKRWPAVVAQAQALYSKLHGGQDAYAVVNECVRQALHRAGREQAFTGAIRTSRPALSIAASGVADGGWSSLLSGAGDLTNLGVSVARMTTLIQDEVDHLARTVREAKERKTAIVGDSQLQGEEAFNTYLDGKKHEISAGLCGIINGLLHASVYGPLVALGTQYATNRVVQALLAPSEVEARGASAGDVLQVLDAESDPKCAFRDDIARVWGGASLEIDFDNITTEQGAEINAQVAQGTGHTVGHLRLAYGGCIRVFVNEQGRVYVQRPPLAEYAEGVKNGKAAGEIEYLALAKEEKLDICMKNIETGEFTTYRARGTIDHEWSTNAVQLLYTPGRDGILGHIASYSHPENIISLSADCFYSAYLAETHRQSDVTSLRATVAERLVNDPGSKVAYHNWSLRAGGHQFSGNPLIIWMTARAGVGGVLGASWEIANRRNEPWSRAKAAHVAVGAAEGAASALYPQAGPAVAITLAGVTADAAIASSSIDEAGLNFASSIAINLLGSRVANRLAHSSAARRLYLGLELNLRLRVPDLFSSSHHLGVSVQPNLAWSATKVRENWTFTHVPRGFHLSVGQNDYRVHPNATKHMQEYLLENQKTGHRLFPLSTLAGATERAAERGFFPGENRMTVGDWQLGIDITPYESVLYHALFQRRK